MSKLRQSLDGFTPGWAVNIYGSDRRLLCTLDPSHAWAFVLGIGLGSIMMLGWSSSDRPRIQPSAMPAPKAAPLAVD